MGKGSTFHFTAQVGVADPKAAGVPALPQELKDVPVLVVDDNDTNRRILHGMALQWKMRPIDAASGPEALAAIKAAQARGEPFRVILTDGRMPGMDGFEFAAAIQQDSNLAGPDILMLTSSGQPGEGARCRELGIAAYLLKPVLKDDLLAALLAALGKRADAGATASLVTRHSLREAPRRLQVLVAEDNPVNEAVIVRVLEKMGHAPTMAHNGREAVSLAANGKFDLVFMDVQMPEMDGLAATAAIREGERCSGTHLPIFAMTAHAMKGDRERCLAAGMDAYVSKPLRVKELFEAIAAVLPVAAEAVAFSAIDGNLAAKGRPTDVVFDMDEALAGVEGDRRLLGEMIALYLTQTDKLLPEMRSAGERGDGVALEQFAHKLRGSLANFAAAPAVEAALRLEIMGRSGKFGQTGEVLTDLEHEVARLQVALTSFAKNDANRAA
jgi:CheY-like chemotaxis protein/HPt (histidine-containing phosphotransfer) domain-containing protein